MRYFDHDTTACSDSKFLALRLEHGSVAIDLYWTLIERMYADESPLNLAGSNLETKSVLHLVSITQEELETYISTMIELGLFEGGIDNLFSQRAMDNITAYQQKAETARQNGKLGGRKPKVETNKKPSRLKDENQSAKLRKEKKGIGFDKQNQIPTAGGADAEKSAPPAENIAAIFNEVDEQYARTMEHRRSAAELEAKAVPCPPGLNPFKAVG